MKFNLFFIILIFSIGFSKSNKEPSLTNNKWISEGSPKREVWFQDWSGYIRLFVTTFSDTSSVDPGPYITETKNKPYLTPHPYKLVQKNQLIGNIEWDQVFSWNGGENSFTWKVDRANPKIKLPEMYTGTASYEGNKLILEIKKDAQVIYSMVLKSVSYY
tara:strand:- start:281 stop:760 length:480 start_codon:yes stop_codon:yes gene_type:complete